MSKKTTTDIALQNKNPEGEADMLTPTNPINANEADRVLWRADLRKALGCSPDTLRRYVRDKKLPEPDVNLTQRMMGWKVSTLRAAGINLL